MKRDPLDAPNARRCKHLVNDPTRSGGFGVWAPILDGTPALAREEFYWEADQSE
jgi:hypothetical protein